MNLTQGRSLHLFFVDGHPEGMLTAEVFNWTGWVLKTPRTQISEALSRKELTQAGVYILLGDRVGKPLAYVGEADNISARIRNHVHDPNKDWWETAVVVTASSNNLHKAHVKYLEARLVERARSIGKMPLDNSSTPSLPALPEAMSADMEAFLEYLYMVLPAIRVDMFMTNTRSDAAAHGKDVGTAAQSPIFELKSAKYGIRATAKLQNGEFIVQAGSQARKRWTSPQDHRYRSLFEELVTSGVLSEQGAEKVFVKSYAFRSPSAAAAVVNGRPSNGRLEWKLEGTSKTYREWEEEQLGTAEELPVGVQS